MDGYGYGAGSRMDGYGYGGSGGEALISGKMPAAWQFQEQVRRWLQYYLDRATPHPLCRWLASLTAGVVYAIRVYYLQGFYIVAYGLGIYLLNLLIGFLSPQVDPESEGPALPTKGGDEFKPFARRLPEFKFWYSLTKALCIAFGLTFFSIFDVPVFWPILLLYWIVLFSLTMKRQVRHMIKYKYVPFTIGKKRYTGKKFSSVDKASSSRG